MLFNITVLVFTRQWTVLYSYVNFACSSQKCLQKAFENPFHGLKSGNTFSDLEILPEWSDHDRSARHPFDITSSRIDHSSTVYWTKSTSSTSDDRSDTTSGSRITPVVSCFRRAVAARQLHPSSRCGHSGLQAATFTAIVSTSAILFLWYFSSKRRLPNGAATQSNSHRNTAICLFLLQSGSHRP